MNASLKSCSTIRELSFTSDRLIKVQVVPKMPTTIGVMNNYKLRIYIEMMPSKVML